MSLRLRGGLVAVVIAVSMHALLSAQSPHGGPGTPLQPGRNINAAGGIVDPRDPAALVKADINAQRQNETTIAASVRNPDHLLAIANDYRFVDFPQDQFFGGQQSFIARLVARILRRPVRKMPAAAAASVGAWTGVYRSCDRGRTWIGGALPGGPLDFSDASNASPLKALSNAAAAVGAHAETTDPVMVAGPNGRMHIVVLGFARFASGAVGESRMFYASYTDRNNREGGTCFNYDFTRQVDAGASYASSGAPAPFIDKPSIAVDADGTIFTAYTVFLDAVRSRVVIARSTDGGLTWSRTTPLLNAGFLRNHGTTLAIDQQNGTVYVAWRLFYEDWPMMVISRSFDRGRTFMPATPISHWWPTRSLSQIIRQLRDARLRPFDQFTAPPGAPATARSLAFPALAAGFVGGRSRLYAAWTERADVRPGSPTFGQPDANGSPRIMFTMSSDGGWSWTPRRAIDAGPRTEEQQQRGVGQIETRAAGPQLQPVISLSGTTDPQLVLMYYESRGELDEPMATSFISGIERRIDVRAARINPVTGMLLAPSVQVSQYAIKANSAPAQLAETAPGFDAVNRQNLLMYAGGNAAFFGDYPHLAPSRAFEYTGSRWRWAAEPGPTVAMWTDSRDVQFPLDASGVSSIYGDWARYTPLVPSLGSLPPADCTHVASRNANPYFAELGGIAAGAPQTFKPLTIQRAFATYVENRTPQDRAFRLTIQDNEGAGIDGSFDQFDFSPGSDVRDVVIFGNSSAHRTVWVQPLLSNPTASLSILVQEIAAPGGALLPNGLRSRIILNPDPGNDELLTVRPGVPPYDTNPALTAENSELHNPQISTPQIATLRIEAPQISSPQIATPQIATPQIATPQIATPQISTPQISTPQIATPQIATTAPGEPPNGTEITYTVTNQGTTTSTYEGLFHVPNVEELIQSGNYQFQVLITRTSLVPGFRSGPRGCEPAAKTDVEVIANIPVPQIATPQIATISNPQIATPQIATPQIATFSVAPYNGSEGQNSHADDGNEDSHSTTIPDQVHVTLRAIRLTPMSAGGPVFDPQSVVLRVNAESTNVVLGVVEPEGSQPSTFTRPDVVVANYVPAATALSAPAGGQVTLSPWSLANEGTATAFPSDDGLQVGFYLSTDPVITTSDVLLASLTHNGVVVPGEPVSFPAQTITIPASTAPGEYYIGILVDAGGGVSELNEGNNFVSEPITIRAADPLCAPVPPGLRAWWPGDGNFYDIVGGRHAASEGVSFADGHVREAFSFNGDGDSLRVADHPALRPSQLTVGFWFNSNSGLDAYSEPTPFLGQQGDDDDYDGAPRGYDFVYLNSELRFGLRSTAGRVTVTHPVELSEGSWHYVAGTFDGRFQRLYLDGVEVGTAVDWNQLDAEFQYSETLAPVVVGRFTLGGYPQAWTYYFGGLIDEVTLAARAWTPAEIAAVYEASGQGMCRTPESFTATDLSIEQTDTTDPVLIDTPFSYILTVRNLGDIPATNVVVTSIFSEEADVLSAESTRGDCSAGEGQAACTVPALAPGESVTVTVSVRAMAPGILISDARVAAAQVDPVPANNYASEGTIVQAVAPCSAATFAGPSMLRAGGTTFGILAGDLNGDGFVDLVSPVHSAGVVTVFPGDGTGAFGEGTSYAAGPSPEGGGILDLNGDGFPDVILDAGSNAVLLPGDGAGGFGDPVTFSFTQASVTDVRTGDFNRDGRPDLAVALSDESLRVLLADDAGGFEQQPAVGLPALPASLAAEDVDRDGTLDLVVSYEFEPSLSDDFISVLRGAGDGTFAAPATVWLDQVSRGSMVRSLGDVNGDGHVDLGVLEWGASATQFLLLQGDGDDGFTPGVVGGMPGNLSFFTSADMNGDTHGDLILSAGHEILVRLGDGRGAFGPASPFVAPFAAEVIAIDLNRDARPDLVSAIGQNDAGGASILLSTCGGASGELSLVLSDTPDPVDEGSPLTYAATVINGSSEPASDVTYTQTLPRGAELVSVDPQQGACSIYGSIVSCRLGDLAGEAGAGVTITVVMPYGGNISSTAGVSSSRAESDPSDNRAVADTVVNAVGRAIAVTSASDSGSGSLREAIEYSNADAGDVDRIVFVIGEGGPATIALQTALPGLSQPATIDGTTQPGYGGTPIVELNGASTNTGAFPPNALTILGGNTTIRGLVINRFGGSAVSMGGAGGNVVEGNYLGTNMAGTAALGNGRQGVTLSNAGNNRIGGTAPAQRNVISGNATGIIVNSGSSGNVVAGNYIGTDAAGELAVPNTLNGLTITGSTTSGNTVSGNLISGNLGSGVAVSQGATGNVIRGNLIGVDVSTTTGLGNQQNGVFLAAPGNIVGGTEAGAGNLISGNIQNGILVAGSTAGANSILGNRIGTNGSGTSSIANLLDGAVISGAPGTRVGGTASGAGNIISGNAGSGLRIVGAGATGTILEGNVIGVNSLRTQSVPNGADGVRIEGAGGTTIGGAAAGAGNLIAGNSQNGIVIAIGSGNSIVGNTIGAYEAPNSLGNGADGIMVLGSNNAIGGDGAGEGNTIAFNLRNGVTVREGTGNRMLANRIRSNTGLGIDLGDDGVSLNDTGDGDAGANNLQNFPLLTNAALAGTSTWVRGVLNSRPSTTFTIWFFGSASCDASGYGEGEVALGQLSVTTAENGNVSFNASLPVAAPSGGVVTAAVTGPEGDTSEFSACVALGEWVSSGNGLGTAEITTGRPRSGNASLELINGAGATASLANHRPDGFGRFGALQTLSYDWFIDAASNPAIPPFLRLRVYAADDPRWVVLGWDTCSSRGCPLQTTGVWQTTGLMGRLSIVAAGPSGVTSIQDIPPDAPITWLSLFGLGNPWLGYVDNVTIGFEGRPATVYNFELSNPELSRLRPSLTWNPPPAIAGGTALSAAELNATASIRGSFTYAPAAGTVPASDVHHLTVRLDPADRTRHLPLPALAGLTVTGTGIVSAPHRWGTWTPDGSTAAITNAAPRSGTGSLELTKYVGGNSAFIREVRGIRFGTVSELSALSFDWFIDPDSSTPRAPEVALRVYEWGDPRSFFLWWRGCTAGPCEAQPVGTWQSSDLMGQLVIQGADGNPPPSEIPPDAPIVGIHIRSNWSNGQPWRGFADNLAIGFGGRPPIVYNFEY